MHFEITRALKPGQQLTSAQRNSSLFAEEPRIGAQVLRRGSLPLRLSEAAFKASFTQIKRLFMAGAIDIAAVNEHRRESLSNVLAVFKKDAPPGTTHQMMVEKLLGSALSFASNEVAELAKDDPKPNSVPTKEEPPTVDKTVEEAPILEPPAPEPTTGITVNTSPETPPVTEPVVEKKSGKGKKG